MIMPVRSQVILAGLALLVLLSISQVGCSGSRDTSGVFCWCSYADCNSRSKAVTDYDFP